ncbi:MAG TPA: MBOAT family protein, partial [Vicinamibacterales bacterium]|nr:MBOAT family protein [Vicinamibacterales bacterium]
MVFNSLHFVVFFAIVYAVYRLLQHRAQNLWLLAASYYFYAAWDWRFTGLLAASTLVSYWAGAALGRPGVRASRAASLRVLWAALGFLLAVLGFFKYAGFFVASAARALSTIGFDVGDPVLAIVLPLGISFYTFMAMAYVVDVYRGDMAPVSSLVDYALFVAYFPHLVAGPILRAPALMPQFAAPRTIRPADLSTGAWLIATGLFKKIVVADNLSPMVDAVFAPDFPAAGGDVLIASYAFALQIYGDFAGYSDMARGLSQLFGIELNVNFRFPYAVTNPREFWRHWHISLSTWLRDYLYKPLGGSRGGRWATSRNLLITMVLGGLWHGAAWSFVLWGAFQGAWLVVHRGYDAWRGVRARTSRLAAGAASVGAWLVALHLICYGWLLFRARSFEQIRGMTWALLTDWRISPEVVPGVWALAGFALPLALLHGYEWWKDDLL